MPSFLTNVFYKTAPFSDPSSVGMLDEWALTAVARERWAAPHEALFSHPSRDDAPLPEELLPEAPPSNVARPSRGDALFWCVFAAVHGAAELEVGGPIAKRELDEKMRVIAHLQKFPRCLKESSAKLSLVATREIMSELMTGARTTPDSLVAICACYGARVLLVNARARAYLDISPDPACEDAAAHIVRVSADGAWSVEIDPPAERCAEVRRAGVRTESLARPLRGAASYKLAELAELAARLGLAPAAGEKRCKADTYAAIHAACVWPAV